MKDFHSGDVILDRYEIVKPFESGRYRVYFAIDRKDELAVVLKFLPSKLERDKKSQQELLKKTEQLVKISSDHTLKVLGCYTTNTGHVFLSLEWASNGDLNRYLKLSGAQSWSKTKKYLEMLLNGLKDIHSKGIVHYDIKPANILFRDENTPVLADFGISKIIDNGLDRINQRSAIRGTPEYMAPESILGNSTTFATDIYSLGIVAFEILSGRPPFYIDPDDRDSGWMETIMYQHLKMEPDYYQIPPESRPWVKICLTKDIENRPNDIDLLLDLLKDDLKAKKFQRSLEEKIKDFDIPDKVIPIALSQTSIALPTDDHTEAPVMRVKTAAKKAVIEDYSTIEEPEIPQEIEKQKEEPAPKTKTKTKPNAPRPDIKPEIAEISRRLPNETEVKGRSENRKFFLGALLLITLVVMGFIFLPGIFHTKTRLIVDPSGDGDFKTISKAIKRAHDDDTIYVRPGIYKENIHLIGMVNDHLIIEGHSPETCIIESNDTSSLILSNFPKVKFSNLTFRSGASVTAPVIAANQFDSEIKNCIIQGNNTNDGILIGGQNSFPYIISNRVNSCESGIVFRDGTKGYIEKNSIYENRYGIFCYGHETSPIVVENTIYENDIGVYITRESSVNIKDNICRQNITGFKNYENFAGVSRKEDLIVGYFSNDDFMEINICEDNQVDWDLHTLLKNYECPYCGYVFTANPKPELCPRCNFNFKTRRKVCPECSTSNPIDSKVCKNCRHEFKY